MLTSLVSAGAIAAALGSFLRRPLHPLRRDLAWIGITGVTQRGRFRLRDTGDGRTRVDFRMTYEAPGGVLGVVADWVAARQVGRTMTETLENLRVLAEG